MFELTDREIAYRTALDMITYKKGPVLSKKEIEWFSKLNKCMVVTGETIELWKGLEMISQKVVFRGSFTPHNSIRDCGSYYIEAHYSRYVKIDKDTLKIIDYDCEDL